MKMKKVLTLTALFAILSMSTAFAAPQPQKIAVVDIQKVVAASSQVKSLKSTQEARNKELANLIFGRILRKAARFKTRSICKGLRCKIKGC